jgi:hypothetical protein
VLLSLGACRAPDATPESAAREVWKAVLTGAAERFRSLYPIEAELKDLFEPEMAARFWGQIQTAFGKLPDPARAPKVELQEVTVEREIDVPAGGGLKITARFAKARVRMKVIYAETDDEMALVRVGERWRALPKEALKFLR